ncbi:MAG TPA: Crp/Fnr family transcriptional regulator [Bacteroidales bacterium]
MGNCENCAIKSRATETLSVEELELHDQNCTEVTVKAGEIIIKEGLLSSHIAYLKSGLAKIHKKGVKGTDQILKILQPGSYIGMQTILSNKIHQYSASAVENSQVCFIDINLFKQLITKNTQFANELILYLCGDELTYFDRFVNIHQKQINGRLADTILFFSNEINNGNLEFDLPLSRYDLAALIFATRESVTRSIKELSDIGAILVNGKHIKILNLSLLKTISEKG